MVRAVNALFLVFVLALGVVVQAVMLNAFANGMRAVLALAATSGPTAILAVLIGVDIGPNLTYVGSLSNLLLSRVLGHNDVAISVGEYTALGLGTVPTALAAAVVALWSSVRLIGPGLPKLARAAR